MTNETTQTAYIILVAPGTYYVAEGHFSHDRDKAARFDSPEAAKATVDIRASLCGWKVAAR